MSCTVAITNGLSSETFSRAPVSCSKHSGFKRQQAWPAVATHALQSRRCLSAGGGISRDSLSRWHLRSTSDALKPLRKNSGSRKNVVVTRPGAAVAGLDVFVLGFEGVLADPATGTLYKEAFEALSTTSMPFYVVTSQSAASVSKAMKEHAGVDIPAESPRILSAPDRLEAWRTISSKPLAQDPANTVHVVEGHLAALEQAANDASFAKWQLYHATWAGEQENTTSGGTRIKLAGLKDFPELLCWGLLMGVNDGCQEYEDGTPAA